MKKYMISIVVMLFCLYIPNIAHANQLEEAVSLRVIHSSVDAPNIDVYINKDKAFGEITFQQLTDYATLQKGTYKVKIYTNGADPKREKPIVSKKIKVKNGEAFTLAIIDEKDSVDMMVINDNNHSNNDSPQLRLVHLSPDTYSLDVYCKENIMIENISYLEVANYKELGGNQFDVEIKQHGKDEVIYEIPNLQLADKSSYSIYAVGLLKGEPNINFIIAKDHYEQ
ncbi:DUF4397 domain-containing protein [Evansella cellulosilytica]|uniref:DUF4397 domain-containing protein n=1 Tax=Evansella cellulosilytica (strain ATCC 21833 / DSM 2522 / FERM P-1141 / JCM 9156 / N-4) TaxID=649639 RepID=E6U099_EVAC2|nr:DUF4397 domain-containing protein [Evansella cellulosilytica]ADU30215.1 hypothetical protein Bcell_1953 [Evansella cellulosilytica DSM 2522]